MSIRVSHFLVITLATVVDDSPHNRLLEKTTGVLIIYIGKPEVPAGKTNGSRHSVKGNKNMGCDLRRCNFFYSIMSMHKISPEAGGGGGGGGGGGASGKHP